MSFSLVRGRLVALGVLAALVGASAWFVSSPAHAADLFTDQGHIQFPNVFGVSTTETEWKVSCPSLPDSQGEDAYVFTLPENLDITGTTTTAAGQSAGAYDIDIIFYRVNCSVAGSSFEVGTDESASTPAGTRFVVVTAFEGSDIAVTLSVAPTGSEPSPSPSPSASPSPSPTQSPGGGGGGGARGSYPLEPNDPLFAPDPDLPEILGGQWGMRKIQAPQAWQESQATGFGIKVAVLDSGLDLDHPDFACPGKVEVIANSDFIGDGNGPQDGNGHGTHVAGIVGACTQNGEGVVGVAPDSTIMPIQVLNAAGEGLVDTTLPGAIRAATDAGAHVINMSIGTLPVVTPLDVLLGDVFPAVDEAVEYATSRGVVVVAAAGNESFPMCSYPAIIEDIVCVGSSDSRDLNSYFGNFPVNDDDQDILGAGLLAPGGSGQVFCDFNSENILSTYLVEADNCDEGDEKYQGYRGNDGTSMASPHVAGAAALVYDRLSGERTGANGRAVIEALISTADDLYAPGYDPASGFGRLNALAAVRAVTPGGGPDPSPSPSPSPTPVPQDTSVLFTGVVPTSGQFTDSISLEALLTDDAGRPLPDENLTFQLQGADYLLEQAAVTDSTGIARATLHLDAPPGGYDLVVGYAGKTDTYNSSSDSRAFSLTREDVRATVTAEGTGSKKTVTATLADADDAGSPITSAPVAFFADGKHAGDATTDDRGVAVLAAPPGTRGKNVRFEARYAGDAFFLPAIASSG